MKKYLSLILAMAICLIGLPFSALAEDYPSEIWAPLDQFAAALNAGNDQGIYDYGMQVISIMENQPDSHLKKEFLAGKYEQVSRCAERLGLYYEAVSLHQKYLPYGEYMGWKDGVQYAKKKIYLLSPYLDLYVQDESYYPPNFGAKFEPARGVYFGSVYDNDERILDFDRDKIQKYFPKKNSTWLMYLEFGDKPRELGRYNRYLTSAKNNNMAVEFAWNTHNSLNDIEQYEAYVNDTLDFLDSYGIPIFLRFGAEMNIAVNGNDPQAFIRSFRYVAERAKAKKNIAMVWSPNDLGALDRPYEQYYPGNEYVDWVGASLYVAKYFEGKKDHGSQTDPLNTYFAMDEFAHPVMRITELISFMEQKGIKKPVMISECGVSHYTRLEGEDLTDWAKVQMQRLYNDLLIRFPQIKMINYFNVKMENEVNAYELYSSPAMNQLYNQLVKNPYFMSYTDDVIEFGYRSFTGGVTGKNLKINAVGYFPKTLYNSVKYYLDGNFVDEKWETPYELELKNLLAGWHSLKAVLCDNGETRVEKEIWFEVQRKISVSVDGSTVEFPDQGPVMVNDRTLVPARGVFEKMGMTVSWNEEAKQVTVVNGESKVLLTIGDNIMMVDGQPKKMDVPAQTLNDRTMIPLRAVSEAMDAEVYWEEATDTVVIMTP